MAKTYLSEILDDTNQARGMSVLGIQGGIGRLTGPLAGGLLSEPAVQYPDAFGGGFWQQYPYSLPCFVAAGVTIVSIGGTYLFLDETLPGAATPCQGCGGGWRAREEGQGIGAVPHVELAETEDEATALSGQPVEGTGAEVAGKGPYHDSLPPSEEPSTCGLLGEPSVRTTCVLYGTVGGAGVLVDALFPMWAMGSPQCGGFGLSMRDIGIMLGASGPVQVVSQLVWYPRVVDAMGLLSTFRGGLLGTAVLSAALPWVALLADRPGWYWPLLTVLYISITCLRVAVLTSLFVLINNSCHAAQRGTVNGIGQSFAAVGRFVGPSLGSTIFAWTQNAELAWPFNFHLTFYLIALCFLVSRVLAAGLPDSIEKAKPIQLSAIVDGGAQSSVADGVASVRDGTRKGGEASAQCQSPLVGSDIPSGTTYAPLGDEDVEGPGPVLESALPGNLHTGEPGPAGARGEKGEAP